MKNHQSIIAHLFIVIGILLISGCQQADPVGIKTKAKMVEELISDKKGCDVFKKQLESSELKDGSTDEIYQKAKKAGCIQKDV